MGPFLRWRDHLEVTGAHHIPRSGPVVLVANHQAVVDSFLVAIAARRTVVFLAKAEYFTETGLRGRLKQAFFSSVGQIPVDRDGGDAAASALSTAIGVVRSGRAWAVHPEGSRVTGRRVHRGRTGAMRVAIETGAPVVPIALIGTADGRRVWSRRRVTVRVCEPVDTTSMSPSDARTATDLVMRRIADAAGWPYVDEYTPRRSSTRPSPGGRSAA
ncbi:lysophospholipid acyltransferase family protein [Williamsia deligens]